MEKYEGKCEVRFVGTGGMEGVVERDGLGCNSSFADPNWIQICSTTPVPSQQQTTPSVLPIHGNYDVILVSVIIGPSSTCLPQGASCPFVSQTTFLGACLTRLAIVRQGQVLRVDCGYTTRHKLSSYPASMKFSQLQTSELLLPSSVPSYRTCQLLPLCHTLVSFLTL